MYIKAKVHTTLKGFHRLFLLIVYSLDVPSFKHVYYGNFFINMNI